MGSNRRAPPRPPAGAHRHRPGIGQRGALLLGHLAPERWEPADGRGELVHELLIAGEGLARGAVDVLTTQLHEAAHALALARAIDDTSRDGRYHNKRYRDLAEELGLRRRARPRQRLERDDAARRDPGALPARDRRARPRDHPPPPARAHRREAPQRARRDLRLPATDPRRPTRPRALATITCAICHQPFTRPTTPDQDPDDTAAQDTPGARNARQARKGRDDPGGPRERHGAPGSRRPDTWQIAPRLSTNSESRPRERANHESGGIGRVAKAPL